MEISLVARARATAIITPEGLPVSTRSRCWRSRAGNPINSWYFHQSQGSYRSADWIVFWYGLTSYDAIRKCVEHALALPPSLQELEPVAAIA